MKVLAFDTSSRALSVAILEDNKLLAEATLNVQKNHSVSLMPAIDFLMRSVQLTPQDLDRIVVAHGPGSYTGLRVAVATAKTLASTLEIDVVAVSSLASLALNVKAEGLIVPLIDARRQHVYVGFYDHGKAIKPDRYAAFAEVLEELQGQDRLTFVGEVAPFCEEISQTLPQAHFLESLPSAFELGKYAQQLSPVAVDAFVPNYLKKVEAEEKWLEHHKDSAGSYIKRV